jgi:DNA-binding LacI/PurR family transcriptional regulator
VAKGPTVYDVAERAGVSIATVSFTFRQPHRVRGSTRNAVLAAAQELGYLPSGTARGLARGKTAILGIYSFDYYILDQSHPSLAQPADRPDGAAEENTDFRLFPLYVDEVQRGVALECWHRGYTLMVSGGSQPSGGSAADIAGQVDGLTVFGRAVPDDILALIAARIPVVQLSEPANKDQLDKGNDDSVSHITVDNEGGTFALTRHLIDKHRLTDLQFAGPADTGSDFRARFRGFQDALRAAGVEPPEHPLTFGAGTERSATDAVTALLGAGGMPQGFVCALDEYAIRLMEALAASGINVPGDVAVTGFDGIVAGRIARPALTTVRQPMEEMGRIAAQILIERSEHPDLPPRNEHLPVHVVLRESCGCTPS